MAGWAVGRSGAVAAICLHPLLLFTYKQPKLRAAVGVHPNPPWLACVGDGPLQGLLHCTLMRDVLAMLRMDDDVYLFIFIAFTHVAVHTAAALAGLFTNQTSVCQSDV